jgi:opacity protein-like surface antigen
MKVVFWVLLFVGFITPCYSQSTADQQAEIRPPGGSWSHEHILVSAGKGYSYVNPFLFYAEKPSTVHTTTLSDFSENKIYHIKGELAISVHLGVVLSMSKSEFSFNSTYSYASSPNSVVYKTEKVQLGATVINLRVNYHFLDASIIDPYIGLGSGLRVIYTDVSEEIYTVQNRTLPVGFEATLGMRILIASKIGVYAEAGLGRSLFQTGISINLGKVSRRYRL